MDVTLLVIVVVVFLAFAIALWVFGASKRKGFTRKDKVFFQEKWRVIMELHDGHRAVLEADKLLDFALKKKNYTGTLGEKLQKAGKLFGDINAVWKAHKLRNRLAHDVHVKTSAADVRQALHAFERALKDLQAL